MTLPEWDEADWLCASGPPVSDWYRAAPGFSASSSEGMSWSVFSGVPDPDHNWVAICARGQAGRISLRQHVATLRAAALPGTVCLLADQEADLRFPLADLGLERVGPLPHYALDLIDADLGSDDPTGLARIRDPEGFRAVMAAIGETFAFSTGYTSPLFGPRLLRRRALRFWVIRDEGEVASTCVTWHDHRGTAYVVIMATRPAWQGRGLGSALLRAALRWEREVGAHGVHLVASDEGARLYRKLGFTLVAEHALWTTGPVRP